MKRQLLALFLLTILSSCKKEHNSIPDIDQKVLFQREYINYAWSYQLNGWLIDSSGNVRSYNLPETWHFTDSEGFIYPDTMNSNLQQTEGTVCKVDKDTLLKYFAMLTQAAKGELTSPLMVTADAGSTIYSGFLYDSVSGKYRQIFIKEIGDIFVENKSKEANEIYNWMIRLCNND
jgi:hypothetical protein